jgi:hypothetical protein
LLFLGFLVSFFGLLSFATEILPYGVIIAVVRADPQGLAGLSSGRQAKACPTTAITGDLWDKL